MLDNHFLLFIFNTLFFAGQQLLDDSLSRIYESLSLLIILFKLSDSSVM